MAPQLRVVDGESGLRFVLETATGVWVGGPDLGDSNEGFQNGSSGSGGEPWL